MNNPETLSTLGTQDTARRQIKHTQNQHNRAHTTQQMSKMNIIKNT